ncbi:MAG: CPBP family intramembrane glutamic endopeptidase [Gemmatimonadales bacterium]
MIGSAGAIAFWIVLYVLLEVAGRELPDAILLAILLVGVPTLALGQVPLARETSIERLPAYWGSLATLWLLGTAAWLVGTRAGGAPAIGLRPLPWLGLVAWTAGLTLGGLLIMVAFRWIAERVGVDDSPLLRGLIPRTREEKSVFGLLSVAAGVGEEIAYRGYAIPVLTPLVGVGGAAALSSVVFGALHAYQGILGVLRTTVMGAFLAWGFLAAGSLWPAIVAHTAIDLVAGIVLGEKLLSPPESIGVVGALDAPRARTGGHTDTER